MSGAAIDVDAENAVNGFTREEARFGPNPMLYALNSLETATGTRAKPSVAKLGSPHDSELSLRADSGVNWDRVKQINKTSGGYRFRGRYYVFAWKEAVKGVVNAKKFVNVLVDSGSNFAGCQVDGYECGVYPKNKYTLVTSNSSTGTGDIVVTGPSIRYTANVKVSPASQLVTYVPPSSAWEAVSTQETDTFEQIYSDGRTIGFSAGMGSSGTFSIGFSSAYSHSVTTRKRTFAWRGYQQFINSWSSKEVLLGIVSVNTSARSAIVSGKFKSGEHGDAWSRFNDALLNGMYCVNNADDKRNSDVHFGDGSARSRISWEGWNPSAEVSYQIPTNYFPTADSTKRVTVNAGFQVERQKWIYRYQNRDCGNPYGACPFVRCSNERQAYRSGYWLLGRMGDYSLHMAEGSVGGKNLSKSIWHQGRVSVQLGVGAFKN